MTVEITHNQDVDVAFTRIKELMENLSVQFPADVKDFKATWGLHSGRVSCKVKGINISGTLKLGKGKVVIDGKLPVAFLIFKTQIAQVIKKNVQKVLI